MTLAYNQSNPLRLLPAGEEISGNHLRKVEVDETIEETAPVDGDTTPRQAMNMPQQPQGYIKAPLYDFF